MNVGGTGLAYNSSGNGTLYIADYDQFNSSSRIYTHTPGSPLPGTFGSVTLSEPEGLAFENNGSLLYVANYKSSEIVVLTSTGAEKRFLYSVGAPVGLGLDGQGNLYIANSGLNTLSVAAGGIGQLDGPFYVSTPFVTSSQGLNVPWGVALDNSGNIFVANSGNGTISEVTSAGTTVSTLATGLGQPQWIVAAQTPAITCPGNLTYIPDQPLYFAATASGYPTPTITYQLNGTTITSPYQFPVGSSTVICDSRQHRRLDNL